MKFYSWLFFLVLTIPLISSSVLAQEDPNIITPAISSILIHETPDPFINLKNQNVILYGPSPEIPDNTHYTKMRKTIYDKLVKAQKTLPKGIRFCIYEAYRSLELQKMIFEKRSSQLRTLHPSWSEEEVYMEATRLVSPVVTLDGTKNIPPHSTGAAIDIYLVDDKNHVIEMGIHPRDWMQDLDGSISITNSTKISPEAQKNRAIMSKALAEVGFSNYTKEYWHWSYGDRYWAYMTKQPYALFGTVIDE